MNLFLNEKRDDRVKKLWPNIMAASDSKEIIRHMRKWFQGKDPSAEGMHAMHNELRRYLTEKYLTCPIEELASAQAEHISAEMVKFLLEQFNEHITAKN